MAEDRLLERVLGPSPPPFALLHRPGAGAADVVDALVGDVTTAPSLAALPLPLPDATDDGGEDTARHETLVLAPCREAGGDGREGAGPLALTVTAQAALPPDEVVAGIRAAGDRSLRPYLDAFRQLLEGGHGAYWAYLVHTGDRTVVGTGPAGHVTLRAGTAVLHPAGGTHHAPAGRPVLAGVLDLLTDDADADRARRALDEGLMAMTRICAGEVRIRGPWLRETATAVGTAYTVEGRCHLDARAVLRETGPDGGFAALIGRDRYGAVCLDSAVLDPQDGLGAATAQEAAPTAGLATHPQVRALLEARNAGLAGFWFGHRSGLPGRGLTGRRTLVIDAGDGFNPMLVHQLTALGLDPTVRRLDEPYLASGYELVVLAAGPGDPRLVRRPEIARLRDTAGRRLADRRPFLAVCLGHQVTGSLLGLGLVRRDTPRRGVRRTIDLFGDREQVGFYDTYAVRGSSDRIAVPGLDRPVEASRDPLTGEVYALRGQSFASVQFRPESVLTRHGTRFIGSLVRDLLDGTGPGAGSGARRSA
ncbi:aminodeoxychorismate/anthranilate synthase component II [Streptomyces sclerotialus]|uniref:aminodeoxychorismate/anthranilate synthase component II n=1 Tax=Streptomyces sclerotialus TaxID=1957 RepID=UPI0006900E35